jgi:glycosyltransferase involved in cell wall biosynthesis
MAGRRSDAATTAMRILFLTQYFPPEIGAPQNRISDLAARLSASGHEVTILVAFPNYPEGRVAAAYRGKLRIVDSWQGLRVVRTWIYATPSKRFLPRLLNYFSFVISSMILGTRCTGAQDAVIVESPPLFLGIAGVVISRAKRARLIFNVSDLWPESAVALGVIRNRALVRLSGALEHWIYRRSDLISGQTQGIISSIEARFPRKPVYLLTNGVALEAFGAPERRAATSCPLGLETELKAKFVVGYAGLHGLAQGLDVVLTAARMLAARSDIAFVLVGDGPEKPQLKAMAAEPKLKNLFFCDSQPKASMPTILSRFKSALIPLRRIDLFKGALPSKMFEAMAASLPLLVMVDGEARALVETAQAGLYVEPENPRALAEAIARLADDPALCRRLGDNGRRFAFQYFDRAAIARNFEQALLALCERGRCFAPATAQVSP